MLNRPVVNMKQLLAPLLLLPCSTLCISTDLGDVYYLLYTREESGTRVEHEYEGSLAETTSFDPAREKTVVLIHGFSSGPQFGVRFTEGEGIKMCS